MSNRQRPQSRQSRLSIIGGLFAVGLLYAAAVAAQGTAGDFLNVAGWVPLDDEALTDRFVIFFDKPIQLPPAPDGSAQSPCTIQPPLEGAPRLGPNYVAFNGKSVPQGVKGFYDVALNPALQSTDGKPLNPQQQHVFFKTFIFDVVSIAVENVSAEKKTALLLFGAPVAADGARPYVSVVDGANQPIAVTIEQGTNPETLRILAPGAIPAEARIALMQGLPDATGRTKLLEAKSYPFPKEEPLKVNWTQWRRDAAARRLVVHFSRPVSMEQLGQHLSLQDAATGAAIPYVMLTSDDSQEATLDVPGDLNVPAQFNFAVSPGLRGVDQGELTESYAEILLYSPSGVEPGNLAFEGTHWNESWYGETTDAAASLSVGLNQPVDIEQIRAHIEVSPSVEGMKILPESQGFKIAGNWNSKQLYEVRLTPGVKCGGKTTDKPVARSVRSGRIPPYISFARKNEYYFPRRPGAPFQLESKNLDKAELTLHRLFPSNLVVALSSMAEGRGSDYFNQAWSEEVARKEIAVAKVQDRIVETPIDLDALFPQDKRGVFCLAASAEGIVESRQYREDGDSDETVSYTNRFQCTKVILWTNIGVLAHWRKSELVLFAHDLLSLVPLNMAKIAVYSTKNQLLGSANTDDSGIARLGPFDPALGEPRVAVAEYENDFTFLELTAREDDTRAFTDQMPRYDRKGYDAFIYADRDLYRPGEPVHARWTVRTNYGDALPDVPLLVTVLKPNGRSLLSQPSTLSSWGTGGIDVSTEKNYPTGKYTVQLSVPGSKKTIGTYQFNLEEFVPNRIKASVTVDQQRWRAGQSYPIVVNAQHLFGAPAADRKCEAIVIFKRGAFTSEKWKGYQFENDSDFVPEPAPCGDQVTDSAGNAGFQFTYQPPASVTFPMKAIVVGRVFELGGRPVSGKAETLYFPSDIALGVSVAPAANGAGMEVFAAAITSDEQPAALDKVNITLEKQVWNYYVRRYYNNHEPRWSESFQVVETREAPLTEGRGSAVFQPADYGYYRVRVHSPATQQYSTRSFYCYGNNFQPVEAARPSLIKVSLDKDAYQIGEDAVIRVESPFDGKGIIVIQGEEIQRMIPIDIKDKVGVAHLAVAREQFPNVWVEATVIHAVKTDRKQVYPFSSFAMTNLSVRDPQRLLTVTYPGLPVEIRPATEAKFDVQVADAAGAPVEAELTLAAVDEGIHGITNYASPDPYAWLCRTRRPDFRRAHYYDKVAYDFFAPPIGGDAILRDLQKRMPSADENWIRPVALWSGSVRTDAAGRASIAMPVPEFTGQLRLVAVACTPTRLGAVSGDVFVRRPYMLRTSMPRFLLPDDAARCRAVFFNNSDAACKARVTWSSSGAVRAGAGSQEFDVAPHAESGFEAPFVAGPRVGQGEIKWEVVVLDANNQQVEQFAEAAPIPVRTPAHFQSRHELVMLAPGETREFRNTAFVDDERSEIEMTLGASPLLRVQRALRYAVHYPYGCVEQTTSCLMPLYLLRKNADLVATALDQQSQISDYVRAGIDRLLSMQTSAGALATWPGSNAPYDYGSVYALHFLTLVKTDREYAVPDENFRALQGYVRNVALDWTRIDSSSLFLRAYALYVLAMDGDAEALRQIQRFDTITMPRHGRYLLAAALARNTQDKDRVRLYLSSSPCDPYNNFEPYGVLNSEIRNSAIELLALRQIGDRPEEALQLANKLVAFLDAREHGSTQETAFIISALVDYLSGLTANAQGAAATITAGDKQDTLAGAGVYRATRSGQGCALTVANTGSSALFANVTTRGVPEQAQILAKAEGGLSVNRSFLTKRGEPYAGPGFAQGDSYVVDVAITCDKELKNVVVVDMLPAGMEIENPRLDPDTLPGGAFQNGIRTAAKPRKPEEGGQHDDSKAPIVASYLDVRDDRVVVALDTLPKGAHHFYYVARGVTPGTYQHPPASAECMYDAQVRANSAGATVEVK